MELTPDEGSFGLDAEAVSETGSQSGAGSSLSRKESVIKESSASSRSIIGRVPPACTHTFSKASFLHA